MATESVPNIGDRCPLTGLQGVRLRSREASELADAYNRYSGIPLPSDFVVRYFPGRITEYYNTQSGLKWYSPTLLGDSDFYGYLGRFPGYYSPETWDKKLAVQILADIKSQNFVDIGCGDGSLLNLAEGRGLKGFGMEISDEAIAKCRKAGLTVYGETDAGIASERPDVLVTLQSLEHVLEPVPWLRRHVELFNPRYVIAAVPCHDTLLGKTSEPLVWPPHHATLWSGQALNVLAKQLGYDVIKLEYEPVNWNRFNAQLEREPRARKLEGIPKFPTGRVGHTIFRLLRRIGIGWAAHAHTALALMERN